MANLYQRTASRGFPVFDLSGQTGTGALKDKTRLPERAGLAAPGQVYPVNDPANTPAVLDAPGEFIFGGSLWGLSAGVNADTTPHGVEYTTRTPGSIGPTGSTPEAVLHDPNDDPYPQGPYHDAPLIDPGMATNTEATLREGVTGGQIFDAYIEADTVRDPKIDSSEEVLLSNYPNWGSEAGGFQGVIRRDWVQPAEGNEQTPQEKMTGSNRALNSGFDAVQGYGGGGKGPGGTNLPEFTSEDLRHFPGAFYAHDAFTSAAEVPHLDAEAAQFIQNQPGQAPWTGDMWAAPLTKTRAQDITPADVPLQGQPVPSGMGGVMPLWGLGG